MYMKRIVENVTVKVCCYSAEAVHDSYGVHCIISKTSNC